MTDQQIIDSIPITFHLGQRILLFVGGGRAAEIKLTALIPFTPRIRLVATDLTPSVQQLLNQFPEPEIHQRSFQDQDTCNAGIAYIFSSDHDENQRIARICSQQGIPVNISSPPCKAGEDHHISRDFSSPATMIIDNMIISVASYPANVERSVHMRNHIKGLLTREDI